MCDRPEILLVTTVLLVPFAYATFSLPDVCAAVAESGYYSSKNCSGGVLEKEGKTCCWREQVPGKLLGETYCQTCKESCSQGTCTETCTAPVKQALKTPKKESGPMQEGGVLEDPTTVPQENNMTFSKSNVPFPQANHRDSNMTFSKSNVPFPQANHRDSNMTFSKSNVPFPQANHSDDE